MNRMIKDDYTEKYALDPCFKFRKDISAVEELTAQMFLFAAIN